ncbi:hypothetical protein ACW5XA_19980, partial [Aeromonas dhakensis]
IENQKLFLMLDAVSAHTDCLIQIVKERRSFGCCGSGILLNRLLESSLIFKGFSRLPTWLSALPLAVSMEAHYREPRRDDKGNFAKNWHFSCFGRSSVYLSNKKALHPQGSSRFHTAMAIFLTRNRGQNCALCPSR